MNSLQHHFLIWPQVAVDLYEKMPHLSLKKEISADDKDTHHVGKHGEICQGSMFNVGGWWCAF